MKDLKNKDLKPQTNADKLFDDFVESLDRNMDRTNITYDAGYDPLPDKYRDILKYERN
jgi:hypothetical protein